LSAKITKATFVKSAQSINDAPPQGVSEIAFLGRSNVGKSSLINALTGTKNLAKSSKTPGKTRLLNFFEIDGSYLEEKVKLMLVDLPGFGYAKVSKSLQEEWGKNLTNYLLKRDSIKLFIHLIDSRHTGLQNDLEAESMVKKILTERLDSAYLKVYTKADKLTRSEFITLSRSGEDVIVVSTLKKTNIDMLCEKIFQKMFGRAKS